MCGSMRGVSYMFALLFLGLSSKSKIKTKYTSVIALLVAPYIYVHLLASEMDNIAYT